MKDDIFKNDNDYWMVADNIRSLYMSDGSINSLLDFERVLDEMDLYAFANWELGELVAGPEVERYTVSCTFMWPLNLMPDPRGAKRLIPFDCKVNYKKTTIKVPVKITSSDDFKPGTHVAKMTDKPVWLVEIVMPKFLMNDIRTGSVELEDQDIDLEALDQAYEQDVDMDQFRDAEDEGNNDIQL